MKRLSKTPGLAEALKKKDRKVHQSKRTIPKGRIRTGKAGR
jgi:hypothetical protein